MKRTQLYIWLAGLLATSACSPTDDSLIGHTYHNITAYFNSYYNAKTEFEKGEFVLNTSQVYSRNPKLEIFPSLDNAAQAKPNFDNTIIKCTNILQFHPNSSLADNALLLIGKCYFYEKEYQSAERKFKEILANYQNGDVIDQATFWLARTLVYEQSILEAKEIFDRIITSDKADDETKSDAHFSFAELFIRDEKFVEAIEQIQRGIVKCSNNELKSRAYFVLAKIHERREEFAKAAAAYQKVIDLDPTYELKYAAQINAAIATREVGKTDEAIKQLMRLLKDDKNLDKFAEIRYELALCYERQDRLGKAIELYYEIIRRHKASLASSSSFYRLGVIKRDISHDYYRAKIFFDSSRAEQGQGDLFQLSTQAAFTMGKILDLEYSIHSIDSVLKLGIQLPRKDTIKVDSTKLVKKSTEQTVQRRTRADYRRSTFIAEGGVDAFSQAAPAQTVAAVTIVRQVYPAATDTAGYEKYKKDRLSKRFELANFYHISFPIPDSALAWYSRVLKADSLTSPKALADITELTLFSIADIYRSIPDSAKVDSLYRVMIDKYPLGQYTNEARKWFGQTVISQRDLSPEKALLAEADSSNEYGRGSDALKRYRFIVVQYPNSPFVPKALLGVGYTFEKTLNKPDSAIITYRLLASKFPNSAEAKFIAPKMDAVKADTLERKRIADSTVKADSLNALRIKLRIKAVADSTAKADSLRLSIPQSPSTPAPSDTTRKPPTDMIDPKQKIR